MVKKITVDPITRIEGHLGVTVEIGDDNVITDAHSECTMFRGFEKIMVGRDPRDPPVLLQRICGVCHEVHRITGERAVEDAANVKVPRGAQIMRNLVEAVTTIYSHAAHTWALAAPDYVAGIVDAGLSSRWKPGIIDSQAYMEAIAQQRKLHEILAVIGGKVPHQMTVVPGGFAHAPTINDALAVKTRAIEVSEWVGPTMKAPDVLGLVLKEVEEGALGKYESDCLAMGHGLNDAVRLLGFLHLQGAKDWGKGPGNFIAFGCYDTADGSLLEPRGVYVKGQGVIDKNLEAHKFAENLTESQKYSKLAGPDASTKMFEEPITSPNKDKAGAYTFAKAPRYKGMTVESGPLARLVVAGLDPFDLRATYGGGANESNVFNRICARIQETLFLRDWILGVGVFEGKTSLADELVSAVAAGEKTYTKFTVPQSGRGVGLWESPRGATGHWTQIQNGKVSNYQVIAGTTFNTTPRDEKDQKGSIEEALVGTPVDPDNPVLNVVRVVRSFDPCLACTVHVQTPEGKKHTVNMGF